MRFVWGIAVALSVLHAAQQVTIPFAPIHEAVTLTVVDNHSQATSFPMDKLEFIFPPGFPGDVCLGAASVPGGPTCRFIEAHLSPIYDQAQISVVNKGPRASTDVLPRIDIQVPFGGNTGILGSYDFECDT